MFKNIFGSTKSELSSLSKYFLVWELCSLFEVCFFFNSLIIYIVVDGVEFEDGDESFSGSDYSDGEFI